MTRTSWLANGPLGTFTPEKSARLERESQNKALAACRFYRAGGAASLAVDILMLRDADLRQRADDLDDDFDNDLAAKTVTAVDFEWGELSEDDAVEDPDRFGRYLNALDDALWQVAEDYREGAKEAPRHWVSSPWSSEAFPKAALGL